MPERDPIINRPEELRTFTTAQIAAATGFSHSSLVGLHRKLGLNLKVIKTKYGKSLEWTYSDYMKVKKYKENSKWYEVRSKARCPGLEPKNEDEVMSDEHPLVTDSRWLKLNNWPETMPNCFNEE